MRDVLRKWFGPAAPRDDPNLNGVFDEAAIAGGCPICRVRDQRVEHHEFTILWEEVNDPGMRAHLVDSWGFAKQHAWEMASAHFMGVGAPFGMAIIYRDLVRLFATVLDECHSRTEVMHRLTPERSDPVITSEKEAANDYTQLLAARAGNEAFRTRYAGWDGACLPHTDAALRDAPAGSAQWLRRNALTRLDSRLAAATNADGLDALIALLVGNRPPTTEGGWNYGAVALPTAPTLAAVLPLPGCPFCNTDIVAAQVALAGLTTAEDDLCYAHAWFLADDVRAGGVPLPQAHTMLSGMADRWQCRLQRTATSTPAPPECPVCVAARKAEEANSRALLDQIGEEGVQEAVKQAGGVCVPHLRRLLTWDHTNVATLLGVEQAIAGGLLTELDTFIRKHDYRYADEAKGHEGTSWYRAIRLIAGNPPRRSPSD